jgi:hypothetical protein
MKAMNLFRTAGVVAALVLFLWSASDAEAGRRSRNRGSYTQHTVTTVLVQPAYPTVIGGWQMNPYLYPYPYGYPAGHVVLVPMPY